MTPWVVSDFCLKAEGVRVRIHQLQLGIQFIMGLFENVWAGSLFCRPTFLPCIKTSQMKGFFVMQVDMVVETDMDLLDVVRLFCRIQ